MRRGQEREDNPTEGFSKKELLDACDLSAKTFDTIRKAARIRGPGHGGLNWMFSIEDVYMLIRRAESGTFTERGMPAGRAWRKLLEEEGFPPPDDRFW
jgi:hypothetical protein